MAFFFCLQGWLTLFTYSYKVIFVTCRGQLSHRGGILRADGSRAPGVITW